MMRSTIVISLLLVAVACSTATDPANDSTTPRQTAGSETPTQPASSSSGSTEPAPSPATEPSSNLVCWSAAPAQGSAELSFDDETEAYGLVAPLTGMHAHAAAWGDLDGTGDLDLVVGTFANRPVENYQTRGADGPTPDRLLKVSNGFEVEAEFPEVLGRTSGAVIVDLDNDGDEDVVLSRNMRPRERGDAPTQIYRNDEGSFTTVDLDFGRMFSGRSIGVLDFNRDGFLDLFIVEDRFSSDDSSVLLENRGDLEFVDVTVEQGIPIGVNGLGIATSDLNGDGFTDFFVGGSNRMFVGSDDGFREVDPSVFQWDVYGNEDDVAGAAIADLNRDGLADLVVGHHYNSTLSGGQLVPVRIYLNRGNDAQGLPTFADVTEASGMVGLPTKAPHVEIADFDNDGWPDVLTTASAGDGTAPAVFRHLGVDDDGVPRFEAPAGLGSAQYWVSGPTADVNRDGRLDLLLVEWEPTIPSLLMINASASGNWLEISVGEAAGQPAVGSLVQVWEAGHQGEPEYLIGSREIVASQGYTAGNQQVAHFGLGDVSQVDALVTYPNGEVQELLGISANDHIRVPDGCR